MAFVFLSVLCFQNCKKKPLEGSLAPGIDQLNSINSWQGVNKVHTVVQLVWVVGLCVNKY